MAKVKLTKENVISFFINYEKKNNIKLTIKDKRLLTEAFRRKWVMKYDNGYGTEVDLKNDKFLGLGSPTEYKSKYFVLSFREKEIPRVANWYTVNEEGLKIIIEMYNTFNLPKVAKRLNEVNDMLFNF